MKHIGDLFSKIIAGLLILFVVMMVIPSEKCVKVHRASIPVVYTFELISLLGEHWMTKATALSILTWEYQSALFVEHFAEKTMYGIVETDNGTSTTEAYTCNKAIITNH